MKNLNFPKYFLLLTFILFLNASIANAVTVTFSYTGSAQTWTVPSGVTSITVDGYGAMGGHGASDRNGRGGLGGRVQTTISVTPGTTLNIYIGGAGGNTTSSPGANYKPSYNPYSAGNGLGGFNGGTQGGQTSAGAGGGATDIRFGGTALSNRIYVAGGGGGGANQRRESQPGGDGGHGGGTTGGAGSKGGAGGTNQTSTDLTRGPNATGGGAGGGGGTSSAGGAGGSVSGSNGTLGIGGQGGNSGRHGGGGGGGYYGGGGGGHKNGSDAGGGGGGGSSYCDTTYCSSTTHTQGYEEATGNGSLEITYTADSTAPTLSSSSPADNATDVAKDSNIVLNFSESVDVESGNITIKKTSDDSTVETIDVTSGQVTGTGTSQITINPSYDLFAGLEYYVLIDATAFDDGSSNSYVGISSTTALSFTIFAKQNPTTNKDVVGSIDAQSQTAKSFITQSAGMVSSRLGYLRHNRNNNNLSKNNIKLDFGNAMLASLSEAIITPISEKSNMSIIPDDWSTWSEGSISIIKIGDTSTSSEKEIDSQGIAFGFDKKINDNDIYGFAFQYGQSDTDIGSNGSGIDSKNYNISMYRTRPLDENNFIEGSIGLGKIKSDIERKSNSNTLTASRDGKQIFGSVNFGKTIDKGNFNLVPALRVDLGYTEFEGYQEVGTDALSYDDLEVQSGLLSLGFGVNNLVKFDDSTIKPFGLIEFGLDFSDSSVTKLNYVSDTSTTYTYTQDTISDYMLTSEVGFSYDSKDNLSINTSYRRIQGEKHEHTDTLSFGLNFKSKRETEYAMQFGGTEDLSAGLNIAKNINGLNFNFKLDQEFNKNLDKNAEISMNKKF